MRFVQRFQVADDVLHQSRGPLCSKLSCQTSVAKAGASEQTQYNFHPVSGKEHGVRRRHAPGQPQEQRMQGTHVHGNRVDRGHL